MRTLVVRIGVLLGVATAMSSAGLACGDKFLMVGRSARFTQVYAAIYPATILLYAHGGQGASPALLDPKFRATLTRAGHHVEVATDERRLAEALGTGRIDIVLSDITGIEAIAPTAEQSLSRPTLVPVVDTLTGSQADAIKARFPAEVTPSDRPAKYLGAIDRQMQARAKLRGPRK